MPSTHPSPLSYTFISGPTWTVASSSAQGLVYTVTVDPRTGLYVCSCKDHQYRQRDCKHIRQVQTGKAGKPRIRVAAQAPSRPALPPPAASRDPWADVDLWGDGGEAIERSLASLRAAVAS